MARINTVQKSRKEKICGRCGKTIPVGSKYFYIDFYSGRTAVRCTSCGFKQSETTENPYYQQLWGIQEDYSEKIDNADKETIEDVKSELVSDLENLIDEVQERYDNIPEQLQDGEAGQLLQDRIDSLDSAMSDIDNEDLEDFDDWRENNGYGEDDFESWCEENGYCDDDEEDEEDEDAESNLEEHREEFDKDAEDHYNDDYLNDFKETIKGYLENIE